MREGFEGVLLAAAGLRANERGYIEVDANCRTRVASIFAVGDVNGGVQLAHAATAGRREPAKPDR